jgi:hypothetical protein
LAAVDRTLFVPGLNEHWLPLSRVIFVLAETLCGNRRELTVSIITHINPFVRKAAIVLEIVKGLERKPVGWVTLRVAVVNAEFHKEIFDIEGSEELTLSIDNDLTGRLTRDGLEGFHDLGIWISDAVSLLGVEALIDVGVAEVVLANDLNIVSRQLSVNLRLYLTAFGNTSGAWNNLFLVRLNQIVLVGTDC